MRFDDCKFQWITFRGFRDKNQRIVGIVALLEELWVLSAL